jgi:hypothetical protein
MIKVENIETWGFEHAIRGMRNPLNSWSRSDSSFGYEAYSGEFVPDLKIGENDLKLMRQLYVGGQPHRKYLRQIFAVMDITAPLYWWKEFDTYKVGTTANSCSTMHKIAAKEFTVEDFSVEHLLAENTVYFGKTIERLNNARNKFLETKDKRYWWQMIQLLPSSYNQRRTVSMTYENVMNMLDYREGHKLDEWREFCKILKQLPYVEVIRDGKKERT